MNVLKQSEASILQLTASMELDLDRLLNWVWIGLIAAAVIFLIAVIIMMIRELARSNKQAKALAHDFEPVILSVQTGVKRSEKHLSGIQTNLNRAQHDFEASMDLVSSDVEHIRDVANLSLESTKQIAEDASLITGQATALVASAGESLRSIRGLLPEKKRTKSAKGLKRMKSKAKSNAKATVKEAGDLAKDAKASKRVKRPTVKIEVDIDKKPASIAKGIGFYRKQKRKLQQAKKTVQKRTKRMKRGGESLIRSGRKSVRAGQKRVKWLRKKFKRGQKRVRRFRQNYI